MSELSREVFQRVLEMSAASTEPLSADDLRELARVAGVDEEEALEVHENIQTEASESGLPGPL